MRVPAAVLRRTHRGALQFHIVRHFAAPARHAQEMPAGQHQSDVIQLRLQRRRRFMRRLLTPRKQQQRHRAASSSNATAPQREVRNRVDMGAPGNLW